MCFFNINDMVIKNNMKKIFVILALIVGVIILFPLICVIGTAIELLGGILFIIIIAYGIFEFISDNHD